MLLILDAPFKISVFFPSKLVDYIGANKPILAITPEGSCAEIVRKLGFVLLSRKHKFNKEGVIAAVASCDRNPQKEIFNSTRKIFLMILSPSNSNF